MISRKPKYLTFFKVTNLSVFYFSGVVLWRCLKRKNELAWRAVENETNRAHTLLFPNLACSRLRDSRVR